MSEKNCFVISPIGMEGSAIREHADDVFDYIIRPATEKAGFKATRADHDSAPGIITERMYDCILRDDLLIGVLTGFNPNVFYEIAVAESAARPLILLIEKGHELPFDIKDRRVLLYDLKPRTLFEGTYVDALVKAINELSMVTGIRPSLSVLPCARLEQAMPPLVFLSVRTSFRGTNASGLFTTPSHSSGMRGFPCSVSRR